MKHIFLALVYIFFANVTLYAEDTSVDTNLTTQEQEQLLIEQQKQEALRKQKLALAKKRQEEEHARLVQMQRYREQLLKIEKEISDENMWVKSYASYLTAQEVKQNLQKIRERIEYLSKHAKTMNDRDELNALISKESILASQIDKLKGNNNAPFSDLLTPQKIDDVPKITNPFEIFTGLSLIKKYNADFDEYKRRQFNLEQLIASLRKENEIYKKLAVLDTTGKYKKLLEKKQTELDTFERALDTMNVTLDVYQKRLDVAEVNINKGIEKQVYGVIKIGSIVLFVFITFFLLKMVAKKYISDNERFYMVNKIITFTNFTVILLILFFNYIENASYLVTILGFASAGIAIAMKDWFMSILGWLVIVFGGSIHVGDRVRVDMDGMKYVGDVLDISLLRITILEDITLTSIMTNRRAGRIIFVPNNYIFTRMIANYTHSSLKTVWDGIKITITFDSNHKKAMHIVKEITKKYSKGYTDITRKQLNKLRHHYSLKNTNVEPRIYSFIEPHGIDIEAWYLTNAYGTLTLRSTISAEILDAFKAEEDIVIAYPTQNLHISMRTQKPAQHDLEMV